MTDKTLPYFVTALLISMAAAHVFGWNESEPTAYEKAIPVMGEEKLEEEIIDTDYEEVKIKRLIEKAETYELQVEFPIFQVKKIDRFFEEDAEQRIEHFIALLEHSGNVSPSHQGAFYVTTDLYKSGKDLFSVVMSEETYTGGANFDQKASVYLVDLLNEDFVDPLDLFDQPFAAQDKFFELVEKNLRASEYYSNYILEDQLQEWLNQDEYDFSNVFIRDNNLVVKFDKYEVTAGVAGMPEIEVPIDEMKEFMNEDWLERIEAIDETTDEYYL
ncbi:MULTISPECIES: DUF3298 and DUF4163 domain-containing protein [Allobacillus]|uniref:DUF3298 and DUF4163 domain-containing protein n=1 Tax=Allobacillus salarius TaxID=1955272 RepID=A0A556PDJ3_9BACI|nr:DUF3298 and DUF4163 domain-containing protein [Allobacillus salarius]TSJ62457.1 DUF3298 and DUF4163 domain-containing protein [Allobacillus salarius]